LTTYFTLAFQDGTSNRRYGFKKLGKLHGLKKDEIDRLFPPTIDERIAEEQNDSLNENKLVPVLAEDDHNVHLEIHSKATETEATKVHRKAHEKALSIKKVNPEFFPQPEVATEFQPPKNMGLPANKGVGNISPSQTSGQTS